MAGQFDDLAGELTPGDTGWLPLDESGNPTGPATLLPPPPPVLACPVMVNSEVPLPEGHSYLLSETGAELIPPLTSRSDPRPDDWVAPTPPVPEAPVIDSMEPTFAEIGSPDIQLVVTGDGFTPDSVINFDGADQATQYGTGTVSTTVQSSIRATPGIVQVLVKNGDGAQSGPLAFEFTTPANTRRVPRSN